MMEREAFISLIQEAQLTYSAWQESGQILVEGVNLERADEPVRCEASVFSQALNDVDLGAVESQPWFEDLVLVHEKLHNTYGALHEGVMRIYNPKTRDQIKNLHADFEVEASLFDMKIGEAVKALSAMTDNEFDELVAQEREKPRVRVKAEKHIVEDSVNTENTNDKSEATEATASPEFTLESQEQSEERIESNVIHLLAQDSQTSRISLDVETKKPEMKEYKTPPDSDATLSIANIKRHIFLKEQDLEQLQQEKELSDLELKHIQKRRKLTKQNVEQLEQYLSLKQAEAELESKESQTLLDEKTAELNKVQDSIYEITEKAAGLNDVIKNLTEDLERQQHALEDGVDYQTEQQFENRKAQLSSSIQELQQRLESRKTGLERMRSKLEELENEIADINADIKSNEDDLKTIDQEQTRALQQAELSKSTEEQQQQIDARKRELEIIQKQQLKKEKEFDEIEQIIENLGKNNDLTVDSTQDELEDIENQKQEKYLRLQEIDELKHKKEQEIDEIESQLERTQTVLDALKKELNDNHQKKIADL